MEDTLSFVLVLLIATTSLNRGEKIEELKIKELNNKRYPRMLTFPRPGRSSGMTGFTRIDRASGLMPFPRVGRSDSSDYDVVLEFGPEDISEVKRQGLIPYPRVGRSHEVAPSFYANDISAKVGEAKRKAHPVPEGYHWFSGPRIGRSHEAPSSPSYESDIVKVGKVKRTGDAALPNGGMWFGPRLGRLHRRDEDQQQQQMDDQQYAVFPLRDYSPAPAGQQLQSDNFTPRLSRESDQLDDGQSTLNTGIVY